MTEHSANAVSGATLSPTLGKVVSPADRNPRGRRGRQGDRPDADTEMRALATLKQSLREHHDGLDDPDAALILAEGETSLLEAVDALLEADMADDALIGGLKLCKDTLSVRLHRLQERRQSRRAILEQALLMMEVQYLERPTATISLADRPPSLVVEEEAQIPACYFDMKPVLNRRLTKVALEAGEQVPGARLSNGSITLTVRRR